MEIRRHIAAPPRAVYRALLDARAAGHWLVPDGMTGEVHRFEPFEGGAFRISLTYQAPTAAGKTSAHTDTYHGRFVELVPDQRVVQVMEFETDDPAMQGEMQVRYELTPAGAGTDLVATHAQVPRGISAADNETGWTMALDKLARLVAPAAPARSPSQSS